MSESTSMTEREAIREKAKNELGMPILNTRADCMRYAIWLENRVLKVRKGLLEIQEYKEHWENDSPKYIAKKLISEL